MKEGKKNKAVTIGIVVITMILAGVSIFTALRLYRLRQESIAPTESKAWDCNNYNFSVDAAGNVVVQNSSSRNEPPQQAKVYINDALVATFDVPSLATGQSAYLGKVDVPSGNFSWRVIGTVDCQDSGTSESQLASCQTRSFTISDQEPSTTPTVTPVTSVTPTVTSSPTSTLTPTEVPRGGGDTPTPTQGASSTSTPTPGPTSGGEIAATSPAPGGKALPDAGVSLPTVLGISFGILVILGAALIAL